MDDHTCHPAPKGAGGRDASHSRSKGHFFEGLCAHLAARLLVLEGAMHGGAAPPVSPSSKTCTPIK